MRPGLLAPLLALVVACGAAPDEPGAPSAGAPAAAPGGTGAPGPAFPPPRAVGCITAPGPGRAQISCDGLVHELSVPAPCLASACGLVVDVHGGTMSAVMEEKNTRLAALGERDGYVVLQPNAAGGLWNAGVDDAKILAFVDQIAAAYHTDPDRVHLTGFSQGGYMTWRVLCRDPSRFASFAPAAAAGAAAISAEVGCTFTGGDAPPSAVDILYLHGRRDALVDFDNALALRDAVVARFAMTPGERMAGDSAWARTRYRAAGGRVFEFLEHDYASASAVGVPPFGVAIVGHCYPGSPDQTVTLPGQLMAFGCTPPTAFDWGEEVLRFFREHPRR